MNKAERERESKFKPNAINEGDGLELLQSLPTNSAKLVFFDPQYSKVKDVIKVHQAPMIYQTPENIQKFLSEIGRVLQPNGFCLLWIAKKQMLNSEKLNLPQELKVVDFLIWDKSPGLLLGSWFRNQAEFAYLIQKEPFSSKEFKDRSFGNVYHEQWRTILTREHPHEKPAVLNKRLIEAVTEKGDLVLDPCAGGFGVLDICLETGRDFLGADLNYFGIREFMVKAKKSNHRTKKAK